MIFWLETGDGRRITRKFNSPCEAIKYFYEDDKYDNLVLPKFVKNQEADLLEKIKQYDEMS